MPKESSCLSRNAQPAKKETSNEVMRIRLIARESEEPGAVVPHAGICEGGTGKLVSLP